MNRKVFFIFLSIILLILDLALSGRYAVSRFFLFFPIIFFILCAKFPLTELLIPGLVYGFLFDIASLERFPIMTLFIIGIYVMSHFLRGRFIDLSQTVNLLIFSVMVETILFFISVMRSGGFLHPSSLLIALFYNGLASAALFLLSNYFINKLSGERNR